MSGYCDSNTGPSGPKPDALANCATPRIPFLSNWTANIHFNFETTKYFQYFYSNLSPMKRTKWMSEDYLCRRFVKRIRQDKKKMQETFISCIFISCFPYRIICFPYGLRHGCVRHDDVLHGLPDGMNSEPALQKCLRLEKGLSFRKLHRCRSIP